MPRDGYRWWYFDALSDDGKHGLAIIAFVGSVFSPYYKRARRRGLGDPENHCAINVALYGGVKRWAMTERGKKDVARDAEQFLCGPSAMRIDGDVLTISIHERCAPLPLALRGTVKVHLQECYAAPVSLDESQLHHWCAVAPNARVEVQFDAPRLSWSGNAYHDMNWGAEPIESGFRQWTWSRLHDEHGAVVIYDALRRDNSRKSFGLRFAESQVCEVDPPPIHALAQGFWGMKQNAHSQTPPVLMEKLEDAPFYTRNHLRIGFQGKSHDAFHESLSLEKFETKVVQAMLPFRMPRSLSVSR